jgi:hypothetical protein
MNILINENCFAISVKLQIIVIALINICYLDFLKNKVRMLTLGQDDFRQSTIDNQ